jgi:hypothetical protein
MDFREETNEIDLEGFGPDGRFDQANVKLAPYRNLGIKLRPLVFYAWLGARIWTGWTPLDTDLDVSLMPVAVEVWTRWTGVDGVRRLTSFCHKNIWGRLTSEPNVIANVCAVSPIPRYAYQTRPTNVDCHASGASHTRCVCNFLM